MEIVIKFSRVHEYCYTKELSISSKVDRSCHAHLQQKLGSDDINFSSVCSPWTSLVSIRFMCHCMPNNTAAFKDCQSCTQASIFSIEDLP